MSVTNVISHIFEAMSLMCKKHFFLTVAFAFATFIVTAQTDYSKMGVDDLYTLAREKAFNGEREEARKICTIALEKSPTYYEIAILMGRTYAWDGKRDEARKIFKGVLEKSPANIEATLALADVELWDDKPQDALNVLDECLKSYPNNSDVLFKKAKALVNLKKDDEAQLVLTRAIEIQPACLECIQLKQSIKSRKFKHTITANVAADFYSAYNDPMYYSSIQFGTTTKPGALIGRINYSHRFGESGIQPEVDFYPGLWKGAYAYLNYGYSESSLYARHRVGSELFQSLPKSFEASLGLRYLDFSGSTVTIYTGSLGWYYKNYWFSARTYITPGAGSFSRSLNITTRRYFADANNYIGLTVGAGFSPDARRLQTNVGLDAGNDIYFLKSQKIEFNIQKSIRYNMNWTLDVYYSHQELSFSYAEYEYINVFGFTTGIKIRL